MEAHLFRAKKDNDHCCFFAFNSSTLSMSVCCENRVKIQMPILRHTHTNHMGVSQNRESPSHHPCYFRIFHEIRYDKPSIVGKKKNIYCWFLHYTQPPATNRSSHDSGNSDEKPRLDHGEMAHGYIVFFFFFGAFLMVILMVIFLVVYSA